MSTSPGTSWLFKMAWRDSRRQRGRLFLFMSSIMVGIAALVAINSFSENLQNDIFSSAKSLLAADMSLEGGQAPSDSIRIKLKAIPGEYSAAMGFASMAYFPKQEQTRLCNIKAIEGGFPFYGDLVTVPAQAAEEFRTTQSALVEYTLMQQYGLNVGDSVKLGLLVYRIAGELRSAPGRAGIAGAVAPAIFISSDLIDSTGLKQRGSRIQYNYYYKFDESVDVEGLTDEIRPWARAAKLRISTVESRQANMSEAFARTGNFLNLIAFIALLLGCIGVASAVHVYVQNKKSTVAILRCLGASGREAFLIYLIQIGAMGLVGSILGAISGSIIQVILPIVLGEFLPLEDISTNVSSTAFISGILTGFCVSILFALLPLLAIRFASPLSTLRASYETAKKGFDPLRFLVFLLIAAFIFGFTWWQMKSIIGAAIFSLAGALALGILSGVAMLAMWAVRRFFPTRWSFVFRQGLSNLYRPNNQTFTLIISIGLGTALIANLFFTQDLLLSQISFTGSGDNPNLIMYDVQSDQKDGVLQKLVDHQLPLLQEVPIVSMRLESIKGRSVTDITADTTKRHSRWALNRENRVTYRDTLIDSEKIIAGEWMGKFEGDTIPISLEEDYAHETGVDLGDILVFNVQGVLMPCSVGSIRKIDWGRIQTNFLILFPKGILEEAPQFHVVISRTDDKMQSAAFQQDIVKTYPNVSSIDMTLILSTIDELLTKVSFVIRFMALFSILTGLLVLLSSVLISKFQRIKETVLLRTIGASRRQIMYITATEYFLLGGIASFIGITLALVGTQLLATFSFGLPFTPSFLPSFIIFIIISGLTMSIGLYNNREIVKRPPLEVLRSA